MAISDRIIMIDAGNLISNHRICDLYDHGSGSYDQSPPQIDDPIRNPIAYQVRGLCRRWSSLSLNWPISLALTHTFSISLPFTLSLFLSPFMPPSSPLSFTLLLILSHPLFSSILTSIYFLRHLSLLVTHKFFTPHCSAFLSLSLLVAHIFLTLHHSTFLSLPLS